MLRVGCEPPLTNISIQETVQKLTDVYTRNWYQSPDDQDAALHTRSHEPRSFYDLSGRVDRKRRVTCHPVGLQGRRGRPAVGRHGVQPWNDDRHHVVRDGSGHLRPPQALPFRHRSIHGSLRGVRHGLLGRSTQHLARDPGSCGGNGQRNVARARQRRIS